MSLISPSLGVNAPSRGSCIFPSMLWVRSTASTVASHVSSATYNCGYSFSADSFERLAIMAPLRAWLSVAPIIGFCQELTTMVPLLAFDTKTHISWVSSLLALSMGIFRRSLLRLLLHGWLVIAKSQQLLIWNFPMTYPHLSRTSCFFILVAECPCSRTLSIKNHVIVFCNNKISNSIHDRMWVNNFFCYFPLVHKLKGVLSLSLL